MTPRNAVHGRLPRTLWYYFCHDCQSTALQIPTGGVEGFLTDYSIPVQVPTKSLPSYTCCQCDSVDPPVSYCSECTGALCQFCLQAHGRIKAYRAHIVIPLDKSDVSATVIVTRLACSSHPQEELNIYCMSCYTLVCCQCLVADHQTHQLATVNDKTRQEVEKEVQVLLNQSTAKQQEMVTAKEYIESVEALVLEKSEKLKGTINAAYQSIFEALDQKRKEHLERAEAISSGSLKTIWADKDHVHQTCTSLRSVIGFAERSFRCGDSEFLKMSTQLITRLKETNAIHWNESHSERLVFSGLQFKATNSAANLNVGEIVTYQAIKSDIQLCTDSIPSELPLGKMKTFNITVNRLHPVGFRLPSLSVVITYGASKKTLPYNYINVKMKKWGLWEVSFIPVCGGGHELNVCITGQTSASVRCYFKVIGRPWIDAKVSKGPDYREFLSDGITNPSSSHSGGKVNNVPVSASYRDYKTFSGNGRVRNVYYPFGRYHSMILVEWDIGGCNAYRWGHSDCYDIQLVF